MARSSIAAFVALLERGVDYDRREKSVACPACGGSKTRITRTMPWEGNARVRYHKCQQCAHDFKSTEQA